MGFCFHYSAEENEGFKLNNLYLNILLVGRYIFVTLCFDIFYRIRQNYTQISVQS